MNSVEQRLRESLRAHAEGFSAHPDAWQRLMAGNRRRGRRRPPWMSGPAMIPTAAAAAVAAIVVTAALVVNVVSGNPVSTRSGPPGPSKVTPSPPLASLNPAPTGPLAAAISLAVTQRLLRVPASSAVIGTEIRPAGDNAGHAVGYFWIGYDSPHYWLDQITPGPQLCNGTFNEPSATSGRTSTLGGAGCFPLPRLSTARPASVTGHQDLGAGHIVVYGAATARVASVTAVLPGGRSFPGVVMSGRGFGVRVWTTAYSAARGVHLVFRDAKGTDLATLSPAGPAGPPQIPRPRSGGVTVFRYPAGDLTGPGGPVKAYLVQGRVGFWWGSESTPGSAGTMICPVPAAGGPALGGLAQPFGQRSGQDHPELEEGFGYAHANVTRVVLRLPGGRRVSTRTSAAGWAGSDLRLWAVALPAGITSSGAAGAVPVTATGYDASGHVVGRVTLGDGS